LKDIAYTYPLQEWWLAPAVISADRLEISLYLMKRNLDGSGVDQSLRLVITDASSGIRTMLVPYQTSACGSAVTFAEAHFKLNVSIVPECSLKVVIGAGSVQLPFVFDE
jgi:hypothetical protein